MRSFTSQKIAGSASIMQGFLSIITLIVVLRWLGIAPTSDKLAAIARSNPFPIVLLDAIKILTGVTALILVDWSRRLFKNRNSALIKWGYAAGIVSVVCLFINAVISLLLILSASPEIRLFSAGSINTMRILVLVFGIGTLFFLGLWYIAINRTALISKTFPSVFCYLGITLGIISVIPPLSQLGLVLSPIWTLWLGSVLLKKSNLGIYDRPEAVSSKKNSYTSKPA